MPAVKNITTLSSADTQQQGQELVASIINSYQKLDGKWREGEPCVSVLIFSWVFGYSGEIRVWAGSFTCLQGLQS